MKDTRNKDRQQKRRKFVIFTTDNRLMHIMCKKQSQIKNEQTNSRKKIIDMKFSKGEMQMTSRHTKSFSVSPMIRERQIKPTDCQFSFIRLAVIKKLRAQRITFKLCIVYRSINCYSLGTIWRYLSAFSLGIVF